MLYPIPLPIADLGTCDRWSADAQITDQYGEIRNCLRYGTVWAIFTLGTVQPDGTRQGIIALYPCAVSDASCLTSRTDHPLAGWQLVKLPYPGGATLLFSGGLPPGTVRIDNGGHQLQFDFATRAFAPG